MYTCYYTKQSYSINRRVYCTSRRSLSFHLFVTLLFVCLVSMPLYCAWVVLSLMPRATQIASSMAYGRRLYLPTLLSASMTTTLAGEGHTLSASPHPGCSLVNSVKATAGAESKWRHHLSLLASFPCPRGVLIACR